MTRPVPLQITFRGMKHSDALAQRVVDKMSKLRRLHPRIMGGRVIVEALPTPGKGSRFTVHIRVTVPGAELVATHDGDAASAHDSVYVALRDSVSAIVRQLRGHTERRQDHRVDPWPTEGMSA
jgi:putative sigma-54 modulation protein